MEPRRNENEKGKKKLNEGGVSEEVGNEGLYIQSIADLWLWVKAGSIANGIEDQYIQ